MAQEFGSVDQAAVQLGKALNNPIEGLGALTRVGVQFTEEQKNMIARGLAEKKAKAEEVAKQVEVKPEPKVEEVPVPPEVVKALTELDKFEKKVNMAGQMVTWHAVSLSADMVKAISSGELSFEDARAQIAEPQGKDDSAIKTLAAAIEKAVSTATAYNVTMTNE